MELFQFDDPIRYLAEQVLAENKRKDIALPWYTNEVLRRYQKLCHERLDENLVKYSKTGGVYGLCKSLLKRDVRLLGFPVKIPERLYMDGIYRPTIVLTADQLRQNARDKRRRIAKDVARVSPLEQLADLIEEAGKKTVGEVYPDPVDDNDE